MTGEFFAFGFGGTAKITDTLSSKISDPGYLKIQLNNN